MASRGRPPHPGPLTPAEERVLACVREGMPNAEIAVRLGVSVNTVRYHVSNLLAKAGAASREELGRWRPRGGEGGGHSRAWAGLLVAKPVALLVGLVAVASVGAFLFVPLPTEEVEPVELPEPFTRPDADELREQGFVDAGPALALSDFGSPIVLGHTVRADFTVLLLPSQAGVVDSDTHELIVAGNREVSRFRTADLRQYRVTFWQPDSAEGSHIQIWATADDLITGHRHRVTVTADGRAWIHPKPNPPDAAYDWRTGEALETSDAVALGALPIGTQATDAVRTECLNGRCQVRYRLTSGVAPLPVSGVPECESLTSMRLRLERVTIRAEQTLVLSPPVTPIIDCVVGIEVAAGSPWLQPGDHILTATDASGRPLSLAISPDGHLYAGDFAPDIGCPCRQGN